MRGAKAKAIRRAAAEYEVVSGGWLETAALWWRGRRRLSTDELRHKLARQTRRSLRYG